MSIKTIVVLNNINQIFDVAFSFVNVPDITQETYSNIVTISWTDRNLHLSKCVDYFYVEHAEIANGLVHFIHNFKSFKIH